jgi:Fe-S cluster assembly protein SufB
MFVVVVGTDSMCTQLELNVSVSTQSEAHVIVLSANSQPITITQQNSVEASSILHTHIVSLGAGQTKHTLHTNIVGTHSSSNVHWLFYATAKERYALRATNHFTSQYGGGQMFLKGIAEQDAVVDVYGMINIGLEGKGTDTYLTEDVLMLDSTAKVNAIPGLEIKTNDVKASHSATISNITEADLFYFGARGISKQEARTMFITGFLEHMLEPIPAEAKPMVLERIQGKVLAVL